MDLSKGSVEILRKMKKENSYLRYTFLEETVKGFDESDFRALQAAKFLDEYVDGQELSALPTEKVFDTQYRINASGKAYLESLRRLWWINFRSWVSIIISLVALIWQMTEQFWQ